MEAGSQTPQKSRPAFLPGGFLFSYNPRYWAIGLSSRASSDKLASIRIEDVLNAVIANTHPVASGIRIAPRFRYEQRATVRIPDKSASNPVSDECALFSVRQYFRGLGILAT
jgi:hypothetical protein